MGITGLIPFLNKSSTRANIREFSGQTVAIDAYCWLHKGAFSCADKIVLNEPTSVYINYCMRFVNMLLAHNIKPILVFDGRHLPAKSETEKKRRDYRETNRRKGAELLRTGQVEQGRSCLRRAVDITHKMALNLIKQCREKNVDCIVAPYEADAQLAYLNIMNIAQLVITEDSDLLLFGCIKVLFKMDINGNGILIEKDKLHISMGVRHDNFSLDKFRYMCILSGCDYLPSLPGIGLFKAKKFINRTSEENIYEALAKLPVNLQMWTLTVTDEYRTAFIEADRTFRCQLVYDPIKRKQVPLNGNDYDSEFVGEKLSDDVAFQLAIGNIDPMTMEKLDDYNPDKPKRPLNSMNKNVSQLHSSIWSKNYTPRIIKRSGLKFPVHNSTKGLSIVAGVSLPVKGSVEGNGESDQVTDEYLQNLYGKSECEKKETLNDSSQAPLSPKKSPILIQRKNPFALESPISSSIKKKRLMSQNQLNNEDMNDLLTSRYFVPREVISQNNSNTISVLDIIDKQESCTKMSESDESQKGYGSTEENESCSLTSSRKSNSELKDLLTVNESVSSNVSFNCKASEINNAETKNYETPKENSCISLHDKNAVNGSENVLQEASSVGKYGRTLHDKNAVNGSENVLQEASSVGKYGRKAKLVLSQVNGHPGIDTKFFYAHETTDTDEGHTSPYFNKVSTVDNSCKVLGLRSPFRYNENSSLIQSTKKSVFKCGLSKSSDKKRQSQLTRFGFLSRPKVESEEM